VFLGCDPVSAPATNAGRVLYGLLLGGLLGLGVARGDASAVLPVVAAQIFAPLIDRGVLAVARLREVQHG
jgi:Na+-translocating ferredoxin:NAD+ oxidoreductase RnfD subunit